MPAVSRRVSLGSLVVGLLVLVAAPVVAQQSPDAELASLKLPAGVEVSLFASEPMITNPAAIDIDTHGRVWVAEIQWYRSRAKHPPADQIKVLEDTDGDGRADRSTVFANDVFCPMSICVAGPRVYVATSPDLWVYEDLNGDLKADGPPRKLLTGFGGTNHDHGAHSLVLGPDHKWHMAHGDAGFDVTGTDGSRIEYRWGAMLRGELDGSRLERVAHNFRNPYEICLSSFGEAFCSDNDNDGNFSVRVCWILEGGNYGWYQRPGPKFPAGTPYAEAWHFRGPLAGFVPSTLVTGFGSPCGMCLYEGDAFPALFGQPLHADAGPREVRVYLHEKSGAGYRAKSEPLVTSTDGYFRPDDVCVAPDGSLYVSDWYDGGVGGHAYNNPDQGRIFRLTPVGRPLARVGKPGPYASVGDAIEGLKSPNLATQFLAREKLLAAGEQAIPALAELAAGRTPHLAARALWVLDRIGGSGRALVVERLGSDVPEMQALAVRILRRRLDEPAIRAALLARCEPSEVAALPGEVARELMLALKDLEGPEIDERLAAFARAMPAVDRYYLEALAVAAGPRQAVVAAALPSGHWAARRLFAPAATAAALGKIVTDPSADESARRAALDELGLLLDETACSAVLALAADSTAPAPLRDRALDWLRHHVVGLWSPYLARAADASVTAWTTVSPSAGFDGRARLATLVKGLLAEPARQVAALELLELAELQELGPEVLELLSREDTTPAARTKAIVVVAALRPAQAAKTLKTLLTSPDQPTRDAALGALVELGDWDTLAPLVKGASAPAGFEAVVRRLMRSTTGSVILLKWIDGGQVAPQVRDAAVALAANHPDANVRVLFEKYIPEEQRAQRLGKAIRPAEILALTGDPQRGAAIFQSTAARCKQCHRVQGFGGQIGPDLTQIGKKYERGTMLETILDPSKAIAPEYVSYILQTDDGQAFVGFLVEKTDKQVVLKDANAKQIRVRAAQVEALEPQSKSMMPELVLQDVTAQDAADLLEYLMSLKEPVPGG